MSDWQHLHVSFSDPVDPGPKEAQRLYLKYLAIASQMNAGTPELLALRDQIIQDAEFQENAADILSVNTQGPNWLDALFRYCANKALEICAEREKDAYSNNPKFGAF